MIVSIIRQLVLLIPIAYVLARIGAATGQENLVWWCYPSAEVVSLLVTLVFYRHLRKTMICKIPLQGPQSPDSANADI